MGQKFSKGNGQMLAVVGAFFNEKTLIITSVKRTHRDSWKGEKDLSGPDLLVASKGEEGNAENAGQYGLVPSRRKGNRYG